MNRDIIFKKMLKKLRNKIEQKRNSKNIFWKSLVFGMDLICYILGSHFLIRTLINIIDIFRPKNDKQEKMKTTAILVSRNDDYGGNLIKRATFCLRTMMETFDEVIYVDWNSEGKTLIDEVRKNLEPKGNLKYVVITPKMAKDLICRVPRTRYNGDDNGVQGCVEVLGRNIAIRRATGDIIVSTNIDITPPPKKWFNCFLQNKYKKYIFYTFARRNVPIGAFLNFGNKKSEGLRTYLIGRQSKFEQCRVSKNYITSISSPGDFQLAHRDVWNSIKGFEEEMLYRGFADINVQRKVNNIYIKIKPFFNGMVFHLNHVKNKGFRGTNRSRRKMNDARYYGRISKSRNKNTWGFSDIDFEIKTI